MGRGIFRGYNHPHSTHLLSLDIVKPSGSILNLFAPMVLKRGGTFDSTGFVNDFAWLKFLGIHENSTQLSLVITLKK